MLKKLFPVKRAGKYYLKLYGTEYEVVIGGESGAVKKEKAVKKIKK